MTLREVTAAVLDLALADLLASALCADLQSAGKEVSVSRSDAESAHDRVITSNQRSRTNMGTPKPGPKFIDTMWKATCEAVIAAERDGAPVLKNLDRSSLQLGQQMVEAANRLGPKLVQWEEVRLKQSGAGRELEPAAVTTNAEVGQSTSEVNVATPEQDQMAEQPADPADTHPVQDPDEVTATAMEQSEL